MEQRHLGNTQDELRTENKEADTVLHTVQQSVIENDPRCAHVLVDKHDLASLCKMQYFTSDFPILQQITQVSVCWHAAAGSHTVRGCVLITLISELF